MVELIAWLDGKKTFIAAFVGAFFTALKATGIISEDTFTTLTSLTGFLGLLFLRLAVKKGSDVAHLQIVPNSAGPLPDNKNGGLK